MENEDTIVRICRAISGYSTSNGNRKKMRQCIRDLIKACSEHTIYQVRMYGTDLWVDVPDGNIEGYRASNTYEVRCVHCGSGQGHEQ
jgi:hypothetical protein